MVTYREKSNGQMSSFEKAYKWRRMSVFDGMDLKKRWNAEIRDMVNEPLKRDPCNECKSSSDDACQSDSWAVENLLELTRLVGALQNQNPRCLLWFRGEHKRRPNATPKACRSNKEWVDFLEMTKWFKSISGKGRLFNNRGELARWAILQHYGAPTPLLDVTTSLRIATAMALQKIDRKDNGKLKWVKVKGKVPHISVFATPRPVDGVNIFAEAGLCLVDLVTELPSHCLRPHVQRAGFIGLTDIVMDGLDRREKKPLVKKASLDCVSIARICITNPDDFEIPKIEHVFPPASKYTTIGGKRDDMSGDYLLRALRELCQHKNKDKFPKYYWER